MSKQLSKNILQPPYNFNEVWEELLESKDFVKVFLSDVLEEYILKQRWYGGKASKLKYIELSEYLITFCAPIIVLLILKKNMNTE